MDGAPSDLFSKLLAAAPVMPRSNKRKSDCWPDPPAAKHPRSSNPKNKNPNSPDHHRSAAASAAAAAAAAAAEPYEEEDDGEDSSRRLLPLSVSSIESSPQDVEATEPLNLFTKGFFYVKGSDLRAGYWVYYRGHCVATAKVWNDEFNEMRYEHQGYSPSMPVFDKSNVSPVSIALLATLDAIVWARSVFSFAHWHIYGDNVDALKLVDMYQRNLQFMKFHAERPLLDAILDAAKSGRIHLHRR